MPFNRVTQAINAVREGFSDETISVPDYVETVHIVDAFNQLLKRMKALDDSRQEFVANVSHELKTPMTSIKVLADSLLAQDDAPAELYREFMEDITSEIDRENQIITDLLALVKMDKKVQDLNIVSLNINDLTELILKRLRPIARKKDVEVVFESVRPVVAEVDEVKMTLIMTNLVENAIKYNKDHGWVNWMRITSTLLLKSAILESVFRRNPWHTSASVFIVWTSPIPERSEEPDWGWRSRRVRC